MKDVVVSVLVAVAIISLGWAAHTAPPPAMTGYDFDYAVHEASAVYVVPEVPLPEQPVVGVCEPAACATAAAPYAVATPRGPVIEFIKDGPIRRFIARIRGNCQARREARAERRTERGAARTVGNYYVPSGTYVQYTYTPSQASCPACRR